MADQPPWKHRKKALKSEHASQCVYGYLNGKP